MSKRIPPHWYLQVFDVNVYGMLAVTQAVVPYMASRRQGKIVNVSCSTTRRASLSPEALQGHLHHGLQWTELGCDFHEGLPHKRGCAACAVLGLPCH